MYLRIYLLTTEYNTYEEETSGVDRGPMENVMNGLRDTVESK